MNIKETRFISKNCFWMIISQHGQIWLTVIISWSVNSIFIASSMGIDFSLQFEAHILYSSNVGLTYNTFAVYEDLNIWFLSILPIFSARGISYFPEGSLILWFQGFFLIFWLFCGGFRFLSTFSLLNNSRPDSMIQTLCTNIA